MKSRAKKILLCVSAVIVIGFLSYQFVYARVYNQSNMDQDYTIGADVNQLTIEQIVEDMYHFPNRFAGTKSNALAVQYIRNYFRETGLEPYYGDSYYHSFYSESLKCSRYYMLPVDGMVENVIGKIKGQDSTKAIFITAHMDSFLGKGVLDNASGVAALLETAKKLSGKLKPGEYPVDIVFVAFNAEESGMEGSKALYSDISRHYLEFYNINMDCVGAVNRPLAVKNLYENSQELYREFLPYLEKHQIPYRDIVYAADSDGDPLGSSDHETFQENGHAAIILGEDEIRGITNTRRDKDMAILDFPELYRLTDTVADFLESTDGKIY